ncbi:MAG: RsmE family RNA methyltransferase [Myxococcales bacterium]|nr:RsmE family RNA methyltransferase [Myxococcales bacterium]
MHHETLQGPYAPLRHPTPITLGARLTLDPRTVEGLHFRKVNTREAFTLLGPDGAAFRCALEALSAHAGEALAYEAMGVLPESPLDLTVVCAVLQRQRMLPVSQKIAELGANRLQPVFTLKSVGPEGLAHEKAHAWPGQCLKGARQCRRASVPRVEAAVKLAEVFATPWWRGAAFRLFLDDRSDNEAEALFAAAARSPRAAVLVVGPEGGFADVERAALREAGALGWRLGGRVLRAETAVFAGVSVLQERFGDYL